MNFEEIKRLRLDLGLTQAEFGREIGIGQSMVSLIENGKETPSNFVTARIKRLQNSENSENSEIHSMPTNWVASLSSRKPAIPDLSMMPKRTLADLVEWDKWSRPERSGDFLLVLPIGENSGRLGDGFLVCAGDVAGHGEEMALASGHIMGWIRGWVYARNGRPRLDELTRSLSVELEEIDLGLSAYFGLFVTSNEDEQAMNYEGMSCGFRPPLLITGPPFRTVKSSEIGSSLPFRTSPPEVEIVADLTTPWRLIGGTDGLLSRIGAGDESKGIAALRSFVTGNRHRQSLSEFCQSQIPAMDDELCFSIEGTMKWDVELQCLSSDDETKSKFLDAVLQRLQGLIPPNDICLCVRAVQEAILNSTQHAYPMSPGPIEIRFRREPEQIRIEIVDHGVGGVNRSDENKKGGGFQIMKSVCPKGVFIDELPRGGTIVTLVKRIASTHNSTNQK